jgi:hypothetical protein
MICKYCNNEAEYEPLPVFHGGSTRLLSVYYCRPCQAEYICYTKDSQLWRYHLYTTINNKMYRWSAHSSVEGGRLWYIGEPGIPGKQPNKGLVELKYLKDLQNITPQNIADKISTLLPFI